MSICFIIKIVQLISFLICKVRRTLIHQRAHRLDIVRISYKGLKFHINYIICSKGVDLHIKTMFLLYKISRRWI